MDIRIIDEQFDSNSFNAVATHPLQSWEWGEARKKMGISVLRLGVFESSNLKRTFQLTFHPIPYTPFKIGYLPRSVIPPKEVLEYLKNYGKQHNIIFFKIEPNIEKKDLNDTVAEQLQELTLSSHPLFPEWTQVLDLTPSEDELLKNMKNKTRYNIRLATKKGVVIKEESNEEGFKAFIKLYFETCKRQKYYGHTPQYHRIVWQSLQNKIAHILIAYYENKPLAAYELFYFNNRFYYPYGGTSLEHRNVMAPNLLMWEAIRLGKSLGAATFDMWGSMAPGYDQNHPWAGFTRFKEGYGTQFVEMIGSYDLVVSPLIYQLYNSAYKLRALLLNIKH